jgi:hypothetical protein
MSLLTTGAGRINAAGFNPNATAYFNQVVANGGSLTLSEKNAINSFIIGLGSDFNLFDRLWIFGLQNVIAAKTSLANPTSTMVSEEVWPSFVTGFGFKGNGSTNYINLNYTPLFDSINFTLASSSYGAYSFDNVIGGLDGGSYEAANFSSIWIQDFDGKAYFYLNNLLDQPIVVTVADSYALSTVQLNGTLMKAYRRGVEIGNRAISVSLSLSSLSQFALARNTNGIPTIDSNRGLSLYYYGSGTINQSNFYTYVQALGTTLGWAV